MRGDLLKAVQQLKQEPGNGMSVGGVTSRDGSHHAGGLPVNTAN